jgi:hypothetical protein
MADCTNPMWVGRRCRAAARSGSSTAKVERCRLHSSRQPAATPTTTRHCRKTKVTGDEAPGEYVAEVAAFQCAHLRRCAAAVGCWQSTCTGVCCCGCC